MNVFAANAFSSEREALLFVIIFCGTFALVGLVFLCVAIGFAAAKRRRLALCTAYADGVVTAIERRTGSTMLLPVFSFRVGEQTLVRPASTASAATRHYEGEQVRVRYDPQNPNTFIVEGDPSVSGIFIWVFGGMGLLFIVIAAVAAVLTLA